MEEKRIFIGSFIKTKSLEEIFNQLKHKLNNKAKIKWNRTPENFHITYKFIGNLPLDKIREIKTFIDDKYAQPKNVDLEITGINYFTKKDKPAILYAEVKEKNGDILIKTHRQIEDYLYKTGVISKKEKKFVPHITLGRIKLVSPEFYDIINEYSQKKMGQIDSLKVQIIESQLSPKGALYKPLKID